MGFYIIEDADLHSDYHKDFTFHRNSLVYMREWIEDWLVEKFHNLSTASVLICPEIIPAAVYSLNPCRLT
jgi:hypothetical protein